MHGCAEIIVYTAEIPHPMNVTAGVTLCGGGARGTVCSHCGSKHKLKVLCLAFCVSCHKKRMLPLPRPIPVPAAALCVFSFEERRDE